MTAVPLLPVSFTLVSRQSDYGNMLAPLADASNISGVGAFHRSHQAMYIDQLMNAGLAMDWGTNVPCNVFLPTLTRVVDRCVWYGNHAI